jgi:cobalamin biosynthesis Mg chelatase CobN
VADDERGSGPPPGPSPGPAVDRSGTPVYDPSKNVDALVGAAIRRQDDLRDADARHSRELASVRHDHAQQMREADRHEADTRSKYEDRLREKETQRLDAIRAVDVANVESARQVAEARANTLATQQQASADALRNQVEQARITTADALAQTVAPLQKSIEDLRQAQYQQQGEKSSKVETSTAERDLVMLEQTRLQSAQTRMQLYALIVAAIVLAVGLYATFHK